MPRTLRRIVPPLATLAALVLVLGFAVASHGFPVRKLELNDNGVWVTNDAQAVYGRLNKAASSIDGYLNPPGQARANYDLDIFQDASAVVARDVSGGRLIPLDTASVVNLVDGAVTVSPDSVVDMRGGTIATLNPTTGEIRAARYVATSAVDLTTLDDTTKPIATLTKSTAESGVSAALAVGADGQGSTHAGLGGGLGQSRDRLRGVVESREVDGARRDVAGRTDLTGRGVQRCDRAATHVDDRVR